MTTVLDVTLIPNYANVGGVQFDGIIATISGEINPPELVLELLPSFPSPAVINPPNIGDSAVEIYTPPPASQAQADQLRAIITAHDPAVLTPEQQEAAALAAERAKLTQKITEAVADKDSINLAGSGLKDRITGSTDLGTLGINDILKNAVFNATSRTNTQKIEDLRVEVLELADICKLLLGILANTRQDDAYLMREKKRDLSE